jgi:hypothetical protein
MLALGYSANTVSLLALVLAIGIVVDDAIVVIENVERVIEEEPELSIPDATKKAMAEITAPIIAITLVLMVLFTIVLVTGIYGLILQQFLPRMMFLRLPLETVYEQIDPVVVQLRAEADELVSAVVGPLPIVEERLRARRWRDRGFHHRETRGPSAAPPPPAAATLVPEGAALRESYVSTIRPFLGRLTRASGAIPHPRGEITVSLALTAGRLEAEIRLPEGVEGELVWGDARRPLPSGQSRLTLPALHR